MATSDPWPYGSAEGRVVLYGNPTSRVCKVLWVCAELSVPVDHVPVWDERKSDWYTSINPKQAVPAVKVGSLVLHESNTIVAFLATKFGQDSGLVPGSPEAAAVASQWTEFAETTIAPLQNPVFFGRVRKGPIGCQPIDSAEKRPGCASDEELLAAVPRLKWAWTVFDASLEGKQYVAGDTFTIGDICAAVQANRFIQNGGFGYDELAIAQFPNLQAWWGRVSVRPAFVEHVAGRFK